MQYLQVAADRWCSAAIYHYANGHYLGQDCPKKWDIAVEYFDRLLNPTEEFASVPIDEMYAPTTKLSLRLRYDWEGSYAKYEVMAKLAEMLAAGGGGLEANTERAFELWNEAAEEAVRAGKGKLSMAYYEAAALLE